MDLIGVYYLEHHDYENMMKYFLMAINKGKNINALYALMYYDLIQKNYYRLIQYYLISKSQISEDTFQISIMYHRVHHIIEDYLKNRVKIIDYLITKYQTIKLKEKQTIKLKLLLLNKYSNNG